MAHNSAQPCGCDPGAKWLCEDHRLIRDAIRDTYTDLAMAAPKPPQTFGSMFYPSQEAQDAIQRVTAMPLQNCPACDGYAINASEAPYCPSCARERRLAELDNAVNVLLKAKNPDTRYMLRLKLKVTGDVSEHSFDSMTARNLFVFTVGPWADVQEEWTS